MMETREQNAAQARLSLHLSKCHTVRFTCQAQIQSGALIGMIREAIMLTSEQIIRMHINNKKYFCFSDQ